MSSQNVSGTPNPSIRAQENAIPSVDPDALARAGSSAGQQAMTGLPNVSVKEAIVSAELQNMLRQAGLQRTETGAIAVLDVRAAAATEGLSAAQQVYGAGESQLTPAMPPRVELTPEMMTNAQTFAQNFDIGMNNYLLTTQPTGPNPVLASNVGSTTLGANGEPVYFKGLADLSSDDLLAAFLKVNINDPNNDPEMHNKIHAISTNMRQLAIEEAKKRIERAQEAKKEAEQYAKQAEYISTVVTIVSLAASVFTMGGSLAAMAAVNATKTATMEAAKTAAMDAVKTAVRDAVKQAVQDLGQNATQDAINQAVQQAVQDTLQGAGREVVQQLTQEATRAAMQEGLQAGTQEAVQTAVQDTLQSTLQESIQLGVQEGLAQSTTQVSMSAVQEAAARGISEGTRTAVQTTVQTAQQTAAQQAAQQAGHEAGQQATQEAAAQASQEAAAQAGQQTAEEATREAVVQGAQESGQQVGQQAAQQATERSALQNVQSKALELSGNESLKKVGLATSAGGKVVEGAANYEAAMKEADAAEWRNEAKRWELTADHHQAQIEEEGQIMQEIMESKNNTVDSVLSMMNASFVSKQKLMAANMTR